MRWSYSASRSFRQCIGTPSIPLEGKPVNLISYLHAKLHIRRAAGEMSIEHCLSDIFLLSCLTWTRPEGAMRLPISTKLCDLSLFYEAAEYDPDVIEFANAHLQEEVAT